MLMSAYGRTMGEHQGLPSASIFPPRCMFVVELAHLAVLFCSLYVNCPSCRFQTGSRASVFFQVLLIRGFSVGTLMLLVHLSIALS